MGLSRKRQKELDRLRGDAQDLWHTQQAVLDRANDIAGEARRQAGNYTREEVAPRVRQGYNSYVQPTVDRAGGFITGTVVPAAGTVLGTALSVADVAQDTRVKAAVKRLRKAAPVPEKSGPGIGTYLAIGAGIVALVGIAYAVWQTFRADDELWVADDEPAAPPVA
jgi:hypothetical protein